MKDDLDKTFMVFESGEVNFGVTGTVYQFPTGTCNMAAIKALSGNGGNVYLGFDAQVTAVQGATNRHTGFELAPGEQTLWLVIPDLNVLYGVAANAGDGVCFIIKR